MIGFATLSYVSNAAMHPNGELSLAKLRADLQTALKQWQVAAAAQRLADLAIFRQSQQTTGGNSRQIVNQILLQLLEQLATEHPKRASVLRLRYLDGRTVRETANHLNLEEPTIFTLQREGIDHLGRLLYKEELHLRATERTSREQRLEPPTYTHLIGVEPHLDQLCALLTTAGPPWLIAIEGIGGIGKTALADALMRRLAASTMFGDFGWVTARRANFDLGGGLNSLEQPALTPTTLTQLFVAQLWNNDALLLALPVEQQQAALKTRLQQSPHLIVIDNLETRDDVECLLPLLRQWSNPSKFLLTSRHCFLDEPSLYHFSVPDLGETDAIQLVRQAATISNIPHLATASDHELHPIYTTVGGNPLALRLVVGQSYFDPLPLILADLAAARGAQVEKLYTHIYRRAWDTLDERARYVWLALPLVIGRNANLESLATITQLRSHDLRAALEKLICLNLVNSHGSVNERYYTLHSLTRLFLQEQVGQWQ